jgi:hypothetical protein
MAHQRFQNRRAVILVARRVKGEADVEEVLPDVAGDAKHAGEAGGQTVQLRQPDGFAGRHQMNGFHLIP